MFGLRSPLTGDPEPRKVPTSDFCPAKTSFGIHVLDEDRAFDPGNFREPYRDEEPSAETIHGLKLNQTVPLPAQRDGHAPAKPVELGPGDTAFGLRAPALTLPQAAGLGGVLDSATFVGGPSAFGDGNATMLGLSAFSDEGSVPAAQVLGEVSDTWVDNMFDQMAGPVASSGVQAVRAKAPEPAPDALPALVRPERPSSMPGFGIVRKKKSSRRASSTQQNRVVSSAGSYENQRAVPERPNVTGTGRSAPVPVPVTKADSMPVARISTAISDASIQATICAPAPPAADSPIDANPLVFGETLSLDLSEFKKDSISTMTQPLPVSQPRDRLSPISVRAAPGDDLKPFPVTSAGLPRPAVQTPGVGAPVVSDNAGPLRAAAFSPQAMVESALIGAPRVPSGDALTLPPGGVSDSALDSMPLDQTIAFSPSMDLSNIESRGITSPSGGEAFELDGGGMHRFLEAASAPEAPKADRAAPMMEPATPEFDPPRRRVRANAPGADLFFVAQSAGFVDPDDLSVSQADAAVGEPRHLTDASRTSSDTWRKAVLVAVVVLLLVALSFLSVLLYQAFTTGASTEPAPTLEEGSA